jgi:hypothetical protein
MRNSEPEETRGTRIDATTAATDGTRTDATIVAIEGTRTKMKVNQRSLPNLKIVKAKNENNSEIISNHISINIR